MFFYRNHSDSDHSDFIIFKFSEQHEKVLQSYSEKWESYKEVYEERPLAQVARKLKLEAANLDMEGICCFIFVTSSCSSSNIVFKFKIS